jgi:hypothetical protein
MPFDNFHPNRLEFYLMISMRKLLALVRLPLAVLAVCLASHPARAQQSGSPATPALSTKPATPKQPATKALSETEELQQAIDRAGNDRASLVRNLEEFLKDYPESRQRPQIYRALVEASLQLRDSPRATDYA